MCIFSTFCPNRRNFFYEIRIVIYILVCLFISIVIVYISISCLQYHKENGNRRVYTTINQINEEINAISGDESRNRGGIV